MELLVDIRACSKIGSLNRPDIDYSAMVSVPRLCALILVQNAKISLHVKSPHSFNIFFLGVFLNYNGLNANFVSP